ncbi:hypothetical protein ACFSS8_08540 [Paracoccus kondratievae]
MTEPVLILTMKWGTVYGAEDVNRLYRQVARHLSRPHRFICFTDDARVSTPASRRCRCPNLACRPVMATRAGASLRCSGAIWAGSPG